MADEPAVETLENVPNINELGERSADHLAKVLPDVVSNVIPGLVSGGGSVSQDTSMGVLFLALVNNQASEGARAEGASNAYTNFFNDTKRRLIGGLSDGDAIPTDADIQQEMANQLRAQLVDLNNGRELSGDANNKITELMAGDAAAFATAIGENATAVGAALAAHQEKLKQYEEAIKRDPNADIDKPMLGFVGIMADMMKPNGDEKVPTLNTVKTDHIDVSPEGQIKATMHGAFEAMSDFMSMDGGAEMALARLHGETWGKSHGQDYSNNGENWHRREGLNGIDGLGGFVGDDFNRQMAAFVSDEGLGAARPKSGEYYNTFALTDTSRPGPANMDTLFTQAMVDRGLVNFGDPEDPNARVDWNSHLAVGLHERLDGDALQARMEEFALARDDITLSTEAAVHSEDALKSEVRAAGYGVSLLESSGRLEFTSNEADPEDKAEAIAQAKADWNEEFYAARDEIWAGNSTAEALMERMEAFAQAYEGITLSPAEEPVAEAALTESEVETVAADAEEVTADVEVAMAYPAAENIENFEAVRAEGDMSMDTVPVVMAGLYQQGQTPMPEAGYGVQADGPAANSPHDPNLGMNLTA